jgi:hypothetical protein
VSSGREGVHVDGLDALPPNRFYADRATGLGFFRRAVPKITRGGFAEISVTRSEEIICTMKSVVAIGSQYSTPNAS